MLSVRRAAQRNPPKGSTLLIRLIGKASLLDFCKVTAGVGGDGNDRDILWGAFYLFRMSERNVPVNLFHRKYIPIHFCLIRSSSNRYRVNHAPSSVRFPI